MVQRQGADNNINIHSNQLSAAHTVPAAARNPAFSHPSVSGDLIPRDYLGARSDGQTLCPEVAAAASPHKSTPPLRTNFRSYQDYSNSSQQSPLSPKSVPDPSQLHNRLPPGRIAHAAFPALPSGTSQILSSASGVTESKPSGGSHQHDRDLGEQVNYMKLRTASDTTDLNQSPTLSPISRVSSLQSMSGDRPLGRHMMPRTSSIDSAISSLSSTSQSHKPSFDANALSQADIENLISTAGSPEAVIIHLLKEKHHAAGQNAQLWKLVDKQRTLILGLNKDLERAIKEKERYKKKVKELQSSVPPLPSTNDQFRAENTDTPLSNASSSQGQAQSQTSPNTVGLQSLALDDESVDSDPSKSGQEEESEIKSLSPRPLMFSRQELPTASAISLASSSPPINETLSGENRQQGVPPSVRKAPPAPLNLGQPERAPAERSGEYNSESEYEDMLAVYESPVERGRRKTRDDDDRKRELEVALGREETLGSSEKENPPFSNTEHPGDNSHSVLTPPTTHVSRFNDHVITITSPKSPGLPLSPRPEDRPLGSPMPRLPREIPNSLASMPMSSSNSLAGLALSPRLPKHPFASGAPPSALAPIAPLHIDITNRPIPSIDAAVKIDSPHSTVSSATGIYQGLMSEDYPNLLLPPNAIPLIQVKVSSSRLRPSRLSYMAAKPLEEEHVFTLSIFSRSNLSELWRVEKIIAALPQLDQQMRQLSAFAGKLPDRSIFSGHSPAKVDARRAALNSYFETLLDTPMDEKAALIVCQFLTSDAIEPRDDETSLVKPSNQTSHEISRGPDGKPRKEGYLTKRGKNFGGWKSRYFTLQGPELKYFESPGGAHLGTIKIYNAQIGKQSQNAQGPNNASSGVEDDNTDNQYRHAFLILEPKKKDSSALVRHVLCAESDEERDAWVEVLLEYVEGPSENESTNNMSPKDQPQTSGKQVPTAAKSNLPSNGGKKNGKGIDNPESDATGAVQGFSFDDAVPAEPPRLVTTFESQTPRTPMFPRAASMGPTDTNQAANTNFEQAQPSSKAISAPTNGTVIQDVGAWGNKTVTSTKEKKRSIWGFRTRSSYDLASQLQASHDSPTGQALNSPFADRRDFVRPVFGIPLAEAVHFCPPQGVAEVNLPAVVYRCIEYLQAKGAASEEGIFRLSGSNVVVKGLRERFNTEGDVDFLAGDEYYDVHAIASLFKQYLRELPTTVLTRELHLDFLRVLELDGRQKKIMAFNALVHRLPKVNLALLRALVQFLIVIVNNSDVNKMTIRNVGIVFAPTLNIPAPVFSMFLTDYESIFDGLPASNAETADQLTVDKSMSPEDIRSPRRQMFSDIPTPAYNQTTFRRHGEQGDDANVRHETGFISMQPSYDQPSYNTPDNYSQDQPPAPVNRMLMPISESARTTKAQRRESSLLFMELSHQDSSAPSSNA